MAEPFKPVGNSPSRAAALGDAAWCPPEGAPPTQSDLSSLEKRLAAARGFTDSTKEGIGLWQRAEELIGRSDEHRRVREASRFLDEAEGYLGLARNALSSGDGDGAKAYFNFARRSLSEGSRGLVAVAEQNTEAELKDLALAKVALDAMKWAGDTLPVFGAAGAAGALLLPAAVTLAAGGGIGLALLAWGSVTSASAGAAVSAGQAKRAALRMLGGSDDPYDPELQARDAIVGAMIGSMTFFAPATGAAAEELSAGLTGMRKTIVQLVPAARVQAAHGAASAAAEGGNISDIIYAAGLGAYTPYIFRGLEGALATPGRIAKYAGTRDARRIVRGLGVKRGGLYEGTVRYFSQPEVRDHPLTRRLADAMGGEEGSLVRQIAARLGFGPGSPGLSRVAAPLLRWALTGPESLQGILADLDAGRIRPRFGADGNLVGFIEDGARLKALAEGARPTTTDSAARAAAVAATAKSSAPAPARVSVPIYVASDHEAMVAAGLARAAGQVSDSVPAGFSPFIVVEVSPADTATAEPPSVGPGLFGKLSGIGLKAGAPPALSSRGAQPIEEVLECGAETAPSSWTPPARSIKASAGPEGSGGPPPAPGSSNKPESALRLHRREILEGLHRRVDVALKLLRAAREMNGGSGDVEARMQEAWEEAIAVFGDDVQGQLAAYRQAREAELEDVLNDSYDYVLPPEDPRMIYLARLDRGRQMLLEKHRAVMALPLESEAIAAAIQTVRPEMKLDPARIVMIERTAFSLSIVIEPGHLDEIYEIYRRRVVGLHLRETPFNLIRGGISEAEERATIRHEDIHNLTDGMVETRDPLPYFNTRLERYLRLTALFAPEIIIERELQIIGDPFYYLERLHGEILAAAEEAEGAGFGRLAAPISEDPAELSWRYLSGPAFHDRTGVFSTAGVYARNLQKAINLAIVGHDEDGQLVDALRQLRTGIADGFTRIADHMASSLRIAERLGGEAAREEVEVLFHILAPSQYRDIKFYLGYRYGEERVRLAYAAERLGTLKTAAELIDGVATIKAEPGLLTEDLRSEITGRLRDMTNEDTMGFIDLTSSIASIGHLRETVSSLKALGGMMGPDDAEDLELLEMLVPSYFFRLRIGENLTRQFATLPILRAELTAEENEAFVAELKERFKSGEIYDDLEIPAGTGRAAAIKSLPLWKVLVGMGLAGEIEPLL